MAVWRMAFRWGNQGTSSWKECFHGRVAAIGYGPLDQVDLSKYPRYQPKRLWNQLAPAQRASLGRVAYEMRRGDIIYVKEGPYIVGRGTVVRPYRFNPKTQIPSPRGAWPHQVTVKWDGDFIRVRVLLGAEQFTVLPLTGDRLRELQVAIKREDAESVVRVNGEAVLEGEQRKVEASFRRRNPRLIAAKKATSDHCEVCGFSFQAHYRLLGRDCLVVHHTRPLGARQRPSKTTLDDLVVLCPNCHAAVHVQAPPLSVDVLRQKLRRV